MTEDSKAFQQKGTYLFQNQWVQKTPMAFVKYGIELFFATSNSVEIYDETDEHSRLADVWLETIKDLKDLIVEIEKGQYTTKK